MKPYPKYKNSGVQWIGDVPESWGINKIKHRCYVKGRVGWKGLKSSEFLFEGFSYLVTGTDFEGGKINWKNCYHIDEERYAEDHYIQLRNDDLLITKDGTIGKLAIVENLDKPACLNSGIFVVRSLTEDLYTKYLYWILLSQSFTQFNEYTSYGSTIQHLYQNVFVEFSFSYPSIGEQIDSIAYLNRKTAQIDDLIAKKRRLIELLAEERAAVINQAITKGLDPSVKMRDSGVEWIGEVPAGWEVTKIRYVFDILDYRRIPLSADDRGKMANKVYDYYGASGIIDKVDDYLFDETTILIGEDGANLITRSSRLAFIARGKYWVNNHAHILKPKIGNIDYFVEALESVDYSIYITGSAQPKLSQENLGIVLLPLPPEDEQDSIAAYLSSKTAQIDQTITKTEKQIQLLQEYRTALISEVVTGKIDVREEVDA